ncbi:MAG TPA: hypothetical protein VL400_25980 [Polyangiaceae bacterium]|nr:hypothetical protein [Polyangiaceae bacterium]
MRRTLTFAAVAAPLLVACASGDTSPVDDGAGGSGGTASASGGAPSTNTVTNGSTSSTTSATTSTTTSTTAATTTGSTTSSTTGATTATTTGPTTAATTSGGACAHDPCATGAALDPTCDPCVILVCGFSSSCCDTTWDASCVIAAGAFCSCP